MNLSFSENDLSQAKRKITHQRSVYTHPIKFVLLFFYYHAYIYKSVSSYYNCVPTLHNKTASIFFEVSNIFPCVCHHHHHQLPVLLLYRWGPFILSESFCNIASNIAPVKSLLWIRHCEMSFCFCTVKLADVIHATWWRCEAFLVKIYHIISFPDRSEFQTSQLSITLSKFIVILWNIVYSKFRRNEPLYILSRPYFYNEQTPDLGIDRFL